MAAPLTPDQFINALRAEGLRVIEVGSWRTHNRNHKGAWGPVHGIMQHHTVTKGTASSIAICRDGHSTLPGPLCDGVIDKDGTVYLVGYGRTNHAGLGDPNVLQAVKDERYGDRPPVPRTATQDGNPHFYGFECVNMGDGKDPWPAAQVDAMVRASAALSRAHRWAEQSTIAHREWQPGKPDPAGPGMPGMPEFRARIKERLAHTPSWSPGGSTPPPQTGTSMPKPDRLLVQRAEDITLAENTPHTLYWTTEYPDDANQHGEGGKTVSINRVYNGVLNLTIGGLGLNQMIEVYAAEDDTSGNRLGSSAMKHTVYGVAEGHHPLQVSIPVNGHVTGRLVFEVVSRTGNPVTVHEAWLSLHTWPLS